MDWLFEIDWRSLFIPSRSILEMVVRGSLMYLALFVIFRVLAKRDAGMVGISDLLVVVLLADAAQNGMAGEYQSVTEGVVLVLTIIGWDYLLNWLGFHVPAFQRIVYPQPLQLVENGRILWRNMRKELITEDELKSQLRQQGIDDLAEVKEAYLEGDGRISVVPQEPAAGESAGDTKDNGAEE
jgi:uncharacterized membrane protein YcaP (DUF421 family)